MKVVDKRKWRRAKLVVLAVDTVVLLACMGGLEGSEPMPHPFGAVLTMCIFGYMVHNLTKDYEYQ